MPNHCRHEWTSLTQCKNATKSITTEIVQTQKKTKQKTKKMTTTKLTFIWTSPKQFTIPNRWKSNADCLTNPTDREFNDDCFNKWCWSLRTSGIGINRWDRQANKEKMIWGTWRGFCPLNDSSHIFRFYPLAATIVMKITASGWSFDPFHWHEL